MKMMRDSGSPGPIVTLADLGWPDMGPAPCLVLGGLAANPGCVVWTGTMEDRPFAPSLRNWMPGARAALHHACDLWLASNPPRASLTLRPHHRHILSDHHNVKKFMIERRGMTGGDRLSVLADPAAMLTRSMLGLAEDHLMRAAEDALATPGLAGVVMCNLREPTADEVAAFDADAHSGSDGALDADARLDVGPSLVACDLHTPGGVLVLAHVAQAVAPLWRAGVRVVVLGDGDVALAGALLGAEHVASER